MKRGARNYGRVLPTHRWQGVSPVRRIWRALKWWLLTALLVGVTVWLFGNSAPSEAPQVVEQVSGPFTRCGQGRAANCVIDGDTIRIGERAIRMIGIDAPEIHPPRCEYEARLGDDAARQLLALVNQGPFTISGPAAIVRDEYGRELRVLSRALSDGRVQSFADDMVASGTVRRYVRGARMPWCE